jgi:autoinducer 2 (AI-2) kinase
MVEGIGFYCGLVLRWFRDAFCELESTRAAAEGIDVYALLEREAAELPPGADGVFGIFSNVMHASRWVHASPAFVGFDLTKPASSAKAACFRALQECAAYVARAHLEIVEEIAGSEATDVVFTSGAAQGSLWAQIVADTLGLPVRIPAVKESTALGAAIYAGVGVGLFDDAVSAAGSIVRFERRVEPQADASDAYDSLYVRWRELYRRSLKLSEDDLVRPLWRAAGT